MRIELSQLEEMFDSIRGQTDWNIDGPCLWGYFFTDQDSAKLKAAAELLAADGYRFVDLFVPEVGEGEQEYFFLHVEKMETHNPLSLDKRNDELYSFADRNGLDTYDGMDVGPAPNS